jgi:hypothetical protein
VRVAGEKNQRMFENERRDPHIVGGDWGALLAELPIYVRVMMRGLLAGIDNPDTRFYKESAQDGFVPWPLAAYGEPGTQFSQDNKRKPDLGSPFDDLDDRGVAPAKIGVTIGIERDLHACPPAHALPGRAIDPPRKYLHWVPHPYAFFLAVWVRNLNTI